MNVTVRTNGIELTDELRERIERKLEFALDRHQSRLTEVSVFLADVNGPRGGADKLCQITASVKGLSPVKMLEQSSDLTLSIHRAVHRLGFRLSEQTRRQRKPEPLSIRTA